MRFVLIAALLSFLPVLAHAEDTVGKEKMVTEKPTKEPVAEQSGGDDAHKTETDKPAVDWVDVESTGTLGAGSGGFDKTLWQGQKRSQIEEMLKALPTQQDLRSALSLQRRLLMSSADTSLMIDDIGPMRGNDLLIQRINKLMDMGLYDDAWSLYTQKADDPYDVSIAQLGMLLLVVKNDLPTACLEEKVSSSKYPQDMFFDVMDRACSQTLGATTPPKFPDDSVLQSIYNNKAYSVSAATPGVIEKMSDLERALLLANGKIRYDGLTPSILAKTPSTIVTLYLMDKNLPDSAKAMIKAETDARGLTYYTAAVAKDPVWKRAKDLNKDPEDQWTVLESALTEKKNLADLTPYGDMLAGSVPTAKLSPETLTKVLGALLAAHEGLSDFWLDAAQKAAPQKPIIYIYLQAFKSLTPTPNAVVKPEDFESALKGLKPADFDQIIAIIASLDKDAEVLNNPLNEYEKHSGLTSPTDYVMPTVGKNEQSDADPDKKQLGITVMAVLNSLAARPDNMYSETVRKSLNSMLNVGLLEDAKQIGGETIASVLNRY